MLHGRGEASVGTYIARNFVFSMECYVCTLNHKRLRGTKPARVSIPRPENKNGDQHTRIFWCSAMIVHHLAFSVSRRVRFSCISVEASVVPPSSWSLACSAPQNVCDIERAWEVTTTCRYYKKYGRQTARNTPSRQHNKMSKQRTFALRRSRDGRHAPGHVREPAGRDTRHCVRNDGIMARTSKHIITIRKRGRSAFERPKTRD